MSTTTWMALSIVLASPDYANWAGYVAIFLAVVVFQFLRDSFKPAINNGISGFERAYHGVFRQPFRFYFKVGLQKLSGEQRRFLFDQLRFYKHLSEPLRKVFDHRTVRFMQSRIFEAREGVELTNEMKLLISATAVQLTFGMRSYMMTEFNTILVYPRRYLNVHTEKHHKGEVNVNGAVVLSWEDFYEGIRLPDDNLNLGIHEFAHVLALQRLNNPFFRDRFFRDSFDKLMHNIKHPGFRSIIQKRLGLRPYAMANPMEFFAVATEAFFENPLEMYHNHRTVYKLFAHMYNLDMAHGYNKPIHPLAN